jgi:hypothetical protein
MTGISPFQGAGPNPVNRELRKIRERGLTQSRQEAKAQRIEALIDADKR